MWDRHCLFSKRGEIVLNIAATHTKCVDTFTLDAVPILTKQTSQIQPNLAYASAMTPVWTSDNNARWDGQQWNRSLVKMI